MSASIFGTTYRGRICGSTMKRTIDSQAEPVTLVELRAHLKLKNNTAEDADLTAKIKAARMRVEQHIVKPIIQQTWRQTMDSAPGEIKLARKPLIGITSVQYVADDVTDAPVTLDPALYYTNLDKGSIVTRSSWPVSRNSQGLIVTFKAGFVPLTWADDASAEVIAAAKAAATAAVDSDLKLAVMNLIGHFYEKREGQAAADELATVTSDHIVSLARMPEGVALLLEPYVRWA